MPPVRRLTAILAADVAGYSRLMGADEEGTHERLKVHLSQLVDPKIKEHRGHTVKNTGDGLLAEFPSVVYTRAIARIVSAVAPYPEAREAVIAALRDLDVGSTAGSALPDRRDERAEDG
jgi:adenylate cyclase